MERKGKATAADSFVCVCACVFTQHPACSKWLAIERTVKWINELLLYTNSMLTYESIEHIQIVQGPLCVIQLGLLLLVADLPR